MFHFFGVHRNLVTHFYSNLSGHKKTPSLTKEGVACHLPGIDRGSGGPLTEKCPGFGFEALEPRQISPLLDTVFGCKSYRTKDMELVAGNGFEPLTYWL